jgi:ABC-type nitrate/sulfonate/bicarbonate transport system substrate-binding protein
MTASKRCIYYARCPVPTASGVALQRGMFADVFAASDVSIRNVGEAGSERANAHFTHDLDNFVREGGCTPPIWARSRGAKTRLLGITFMREPLGVYVRADDDIDGLQDLAGRRFALPVWPRLIFNFWRVAAHIGILSALDAHGMNASDIQFIDVTEDNNPHRRLNTAVGSVIDDDEKSEYDGQLQALLGGQVDAIFTKGAESAIMVRQAQGAVRLLYDVNQSGQVQHLINNSTPRLLTCSEELLKRYPQDVETYLSGIVKAAQWASQNTDELNTLVARECSIDIDDINVFFPRDYASEFLPELTEDLLQRTNTMKQFMLEHRYIEDDFSIGDWALREPMQHAVEMAS